MVAGEPRDRRIEGAAKAALGGADDEQMRLVLAGAGEQPRRVGAAGERRGEVGEHRAMRAA